MHCPHCNSCAKFALAAVAMTMAAVVWVHHQVGWGQFDPRQFQDTEQIEATVLSVRMDRDYFRIHCRVTNQGPRTAEQVVLSARIRDTLGNVVASNPLASVSGLLPQTSRETSILLPVGTIATQHKAEVESTLVRWAQ